MTTRYYRGEPYHVVGRIEADNDTTAARGERVMLRHVRYGAGMHTAELFVAPKGEVCSGWVIGVIPETESKLPAALRSNKPPFRAIICVRGMTENKIYGAKLTVLRERAVRLLTRYKPGFMSCHPEKIQIQVRKLNRNTADTWLDLEAIPYESIPESQLVWKKKLT